VSGRTEAQIARIESAGAVSRQAVTASRTWASSTTTISVRSDCAAPSAGPERLDGAELDQRAPRLAGRVIDRDRRARGEQIAPDRAAHSTGAEQSHAGCLVRDQW